MQASKPQENKALEKALPTWKGDAWWKVGDWVLFRHRYWYEEERVSLSDFTLRGLGEALTRGAGVPQDVLGYLSRLDEQQGVPRHGAGLLGLRPRAVRRLVIGVRDGFSRR